MFKGMKEFFSVGDSLVLLIVCMMISAVSCKFDEDDFDFSRVGIKDYNAAWVANLVDAEVKISDFVSDTGINDNISLKTDSNDHHFFIKIDFQVNYDSLNPKRWLELDSICGTEVYMAKNVQGSLTSATDIQAVLSHPFARVDTIHTSSGLIKLNLTTPADTSNFSAMFSSNFIYTKENGVLQKYVKKLYFGTNYVDTRDMYFILGEDSIVQIHLDFVQTAFTGLYKDSSQVPIYIDYDVRIPDYHYVVGEIYRDTTVELVKGESNYSLLKNNMKFAVKLNSVKTLFDIKTNVGIPLRFTLDKYNYINTDNHRIYNILSGNDCYFDINVPQIRGTERHTRDSLCLNSNMVLGNEGILSYKASGTLKKGSFFVDDRAFYDISAHAEIPLDLTIEEFVYRDTFSFKLSQLDSIPDSLWNYVQSMVLRYEFINGIPLNLEVQTYFTDDRYKKVDSLFTHLKLLNGASVNPNTHLVTSPSTSGKNDINFNKGRIEAISKATNLIVVAKASSTNQDRIVLSSDQTLRVRIGAKVDVKATIRSK